MHKGISYMCMNTSADEISIVKLLSRRIYAFIIWMCPHKDNGQTHTHVTWHGRKLGEFFFFSFLWLCWVFAALSSLSPVVVSEGSCSSWCLGFSLCWLPLLWGIGSRSTRFSSCSAWALQVRLVGWVASRHVGSSQIRDQPWVPCIGRWIPTHCATREVPEK